MALLNQDRPRRSRTRLALLAYGCLAAGCTLIGALASKERPFGFDHALHATEGLECDACHVSWETDDEPGMPVKAGCNLCHEAIDAEKPPERRIDSLFDGEKYKAQRVTALSEEVVFSHQKHATKPIECGACHAGIATNTYVDASLAVTMADCQTCHKKEAVANQCATCHRQIRADVPPETHAFQWMKLHGSTVRAHDEATVNDCSLCHQESSCRDCHQAMPPENHSNYFRLRGHGLYARMDRQSCVACHRSDSCDSCHASTRPLNHTGAFAGSLQTHCLNCHLPVEDTECFTCHKGTPSHALAAPKPVDHTAGMNCRQCHGMGQPLPHVDNGDDCNACHR